MGKIKSYLMKWLGINDLVNQHNILQSRYDSLQKYYDNLMKEIQLMERQDIDISPYSRSQNTIVLTGVYKGVGYVKFYDIPHSEFVHYVERMKHEEKASLIRNVDAPPQFRGYFKL